MSDRYDRTNERIARAEANGLDAIPTLLGVAVALLDEAVKQTSGVLTEEIAGFLRAYEEHRDAVLGGS